MKSEFLISGIETGQLNAMVKNIMFQTGIKDPEEAVRMLNSGKLKVSLPNKQKTWREKNDIVYISVTSNGTTGEEWISRLEFKGVRIEDQVKDVLRSEDFKSTSGVTSEIAILKGMIWCDKDQITQNIRTYGKEHQFLTPNLEVACLIMENLCYEDIRAMKLRWIKTMHEPIKRNSDDKPFLLDIVYKDNEFRLSMGYDHPEFLRWFHSTGFAFVVSSSSAV